MDMDIQEEKEQRWVLNLQIILNKDCSFFFFFTWLE